MDTLEPQSVPETNREEKEERKGAGFFASLLNKLGLGGGAEGSAGIGAVSSGASGAGIASGVLATKAGIVAQMQVSDGRNAWILNVRPKGIAGYPFDATAFHTYRITARDGIANLSVDEKLLPDNCLILMKYPRNALLIGDPPAAF